MVLKIVLRVSFLFRAGVEFSAAGASIS